MAKLVFYPSLCILFLYFPLRAGSIVGTIRDAQSQKAVSQVTVTLEQKNASVKTDSAGTYRFGEVEPGSYTLQFVHNNYEPVTRTDVYVAGKEEKRVDVDLVFRILTLEKMVVRSTAFLRSADMSSSTKIIDADELLRAPGALVDVQRVVQNLPSVTSGGDNVNEVVVRGGSPGENLLVMDHLEIPNPNHFADQRTGGGVISLINPLLVRGITFNAGAPPAQYGGKASSVLDVTLREGNNRIVLGGVDLGMAGAGGHVEGPLWKGANFMLSGHKSYLDFVASFASDVAIPKFWGVQAKVSQKIREHKINVNAIYGDNTITIEQLRSQNIEYDIIKSGGVVYVGGLSWEARWKAYLTTLLVVSGTGNTYDRLTMNPPRDTVVNQTTQNLPADTFFFSNSWNDEQMAKAECALNFKANKILIGGYGKRCNFMINQEDKPDTLKDFILDTVNGIPVINKKTGKPYVYSEYASVHDTAYKYGAYVSATVHAFNRMRIVPGIRFDGFTYTDHYSVSPRLGMVYSVKENLDLTAAFGLQYQDPDFVELAIDPANHFLKPKRAVSGIGGLEYTIASSDIKCMCEAFYKRYDNILYSASLLNAIVDTGDLFSKSNRLLDNGRGYSYGVELFAQKKLTHTFFWSLALALSKSYYKDMRAGHEGRWYDGDYDFRYSFTATGGCKKELLKYEWYKKRFHDRLWFKLLSFIMPIADRVELSAKWRLLDGRPYTEKIYSSRYKHWYVDPDADINNARLEPYHKLDIRIERRYGFGFVQLIYYFDIQNVYSKKNIWTYLYPAARNEKLPVYQFPFFPAGGIIIGF